MKIWTKPIKLEWGNLSPHDWIIILSSVLLPSNQINFYSHFGNEKICLEAILLKTRMCYDSEISSIENGLSAAEQESVKAIRCDAKKEVGPVKDALLKIRMPSELSDPSHWGYIGWKYIEFCRSLNKQE